MSDDDLSPKELMTALAKIIASNPADVIAEISKANDPRPLAERIAALPPEMKFCIAGIKFDKFGPSITMISKTSAIELAGKALAMWTDRTVLEDQRRPAVADAGSLSGMSTQQKAEWFGEMVNGPH